MAIGEMEPRGLQISVRLGEHLCRTRLLSGNDFFLCEKEDRAENVISNALPSFGLTINNFFNCADGQMILSGEC